MVNVKSKIHALNDYYSLKLSKDKKNKKLYCKDGGGGCLLSLYH